MLPWVVSSPGSDLTTNSPCTSYLIGHEVDKNSDDLIILTIKYRRSGTPANESSQPIALISGKEKLVELARDINRYDEDYPSQKRIHEKLDLLLSRNQKLGGFSRTIRFASFGN